MRIVGHEGIHQRHDETFAVGYRAGHAQQALGLRGEVADRAQGFVAGVLQALAMLQEGLSGFAQRYSPGAAVEQAGLQALLQAGDLAADVRRGNAHAFGCRGELPGFGDSDEFVESFPAIHLDCPCNGGTLFLDEIGDMPLALQTRLLRVLEERRVVPLGGEPEDVDVRLISATHRDLAGLVADGRFREDLYYRLNGMVVSLPPLRERSDREELLDYLLAEEARGQRIQLDGEVRQGLLAYRWPGNVRQMRTVLRTLVALCEDGRVGRGPGPGAVHRLVGAVQEHRRLLRHLRARPRARPVEYLLRLRRAGGDAVRRLVRLPVDA